MQVLINASINGHAVWGSPVGLAAKAYGIAVCITLEDRVKYTAVRFS